MLLSSFGFHLQCNSNGFFKTIFGSDKPSPKLLFQSFNNISFFFPSGRVFLKKQNISLVVITLAIILFLREMYKEKESTMQIKERDTWETVATSKNLETICEPNTTAAEIENFDSFPLSMKNFLYYQHCHNFRVLLDPRNKCGGPIKSEVFLLLVIKTSPGNIERRQAIRKTWAEETEHNGATVRRLFITGTTGEGFQKILLNNQLKLEQQVYNDVLQWDFTESHYNLTLKQVLFLEWVEKKCPRVSFVLNGDDDVLARPDNIANYLQSLRDGNGSRHLFAGNVMPANHPFRNMKSKYFVPVEVHESNDYPPFCSGAGILISKYTLSVMYKLSQLIPLFPLDDVYLGIILAKVGLKPQQIAGMKVFQNNVNAMTLHPCIYKNDLAVHGFSPTHLYIIWQRIHDPYLKC